MESYDLVIIGTGMGGGALAYALRDSGRKILLLERGDYLPSEPDNWNPEAVFNQKKYKPKEQWYDDSGNTFPPGVHYFVGGNTKVYGAALPRFRKEDFANLEHEEGVSPAWPVTYAEFEPYYSRAEQMLFVHGETGADPTAPPRSAPFPFPAVPHEPYIEDLKKRLERQGLHPFFLPLGIDLRQGGRCIRCKTCDGFPCKVDAKADADMSCVRPALASGNIELMTRAFVRRLVTNPSGKKVIEVEIERDGQSLRIGADTFVVSCGAVNSTALLLRSASSLHPNGLANSSGLVGRNYMVLTANQRWVPKPILGAFAHRSVDWWVMSEDLPDPQNRVTLGADGRIEVRFRPNNGRAHNRLIRSATRMLRKAGFPIVLIQRMGIETNSHQCGTIRFGTDPTKSVLDPFNRSHDVPNLFVVDSSFFPSSAAVNPALTIAAQALRVADHIQGRISDCH